VALAPPEDDLLRKLDGVTGLIITGRGGVGKTRLTLELGRRAKQQGWLVMRAAASFSDAAVDELLAWLGDAAGVMLLIDYVETIATFTDRVEHDRAARAAELRPSDRKRPDEASGRVPDG
jgi:CO dehydrogenase nickel-insertion accessory protein CooC1